MPSHWNCYVTVADANASAARAAELGATLEHVKAGLEGFAAAFGRVERLAEVVVGAMAQGVDRPRELDAVELDR